MDHSAITIFGCVWLYQGDSPWHFVTIEKADADKIKADFIWPPKGFGSIPVMVTIGKTEWKTSIFPDKAGTYVLPLKKDVRRTEHISVGDSITVSLRVLN